MNINLEEIFGSSIEESCQESENQSYQPSFGLRTVEIYQKNNKINSPIFDQENSTKSIVRTPMRSNTPSAITIKTQQSSISSNLPGERLYYQTKMKMDKKRQQFQKIRLQKIREEEKGATFKPKLNKNSQKMIQSKANKKKKGMKKGTKIVSTFLNNQHRQNMQCTFKPQKFSKPSPIFQRNYKKQQVFQHLFSTHKLKNIKQKMINEWQKEVEDQKIKKLSKQQFDRFLTRSSQFINKVETKKQMISSTSSQYDLKTGRRLFSPKINDYESTQKSMMLSRKSKNSLAKTSNQMKVEYFSSKQKQIKTQPIFSKNICQYQLINEEQQEDQIPTLKETYSHEIQRNNINQQEQQTRIQRLKSISLKKKKSRFLQMSSDVPTFAVADVVEYPSEKLDLFSGSRVESQEKSRVQKWQMSQQSFQQSQQRARAGTHYQEYGKDSRLRLQSM